MNDQAVFTHAPASRAARDVASIIHPYTHLKRHLTAGPLVITRGEGIYVFDEAGSQYIEAMSGLWCASLGFSNERLAQAAMRGLQQLPFYHGFGGKAAGPTIELAERLLGLAPVPMSKVFFANSGSEAADTAVKLIWYYNNAIGRPRKKKLISRHLAYHGVTVAAASLTGLAANHRDFDLPLPQMLHTDCPHHYRFAEVGEDEEQFATRLAENLERLIDREGAETIAAMFIEPVMGAGGVILPPATYFEKIQPILRNNDILLVADEVICGFGRTGQLWGCQTYGIRPDIITCAKALSSGYLPISAVMISEPIWQAMLEESDKIGMFAHGYTYSGHPVPATVALETLAIYEEMAVIDRVRQVSPALQEGLRRLGEHPLVGDARGIGLVGALELVRNKVSRKPFAPAIGVAAHVAKCAEKHGLIVRPLTGDVVAFSPPLIITVEEIEEIIRRAGCALDDTWAWLRHQDQRAEYE
ncbi:MAG: aminotransferase class III-fold pyridoxal phosphate-dependent enzyme [Rhodospirillales bacterium]|nr:aminotransferase class III-fold pyridoxal phosphate-dependent enzyme [Rhodospirillales bacterium]